MMTINSAVVGHDRIPTVGNNDEPLDVICIV